MRCAEKYLKVREDSPNVLLKAHVNHPVSLIQSQIAADIQTHHLLVQQVHQSARSGHHHVHPTTITSSFRSL